MHTARSYSEIFNSFVCCNCWLLIVLFLYTLLLYIIVHWNWKRDEKKARCNYDLPLTFLLLPLPYSVPKMILFNRISLCISFYLFGAEIEYNEHFHDYFWALNNYGRRTEEIDRERETRSKETRAKSIWNEKRHRSNWRIKSILYVLTTAAAANILFNCCVCTSIIKSKRKK